MEDFLLFKLLSGFVIGLIFGSFTGALSYRLPRGLSIARPPSSCPTCGARLGARDLVPVFSWIFSKGKCRHCGQKVSARYPLIELAVALGFMAAFGLIGFNLALIPALALIVAFVTVVAIRIERDRGLGTRD